MGPLAGPLVVAGVLLDYGGLRDHRVRPLALLNDSKQVAPGDARGALPRRPRLRGARLGPRLPARSDRPGRPARLEPPRPPRGALGVPARRCLARRRLQARPVGAGAPSGRRRRHEERGHRRGVDRREGDPRPLHARRRRPVSRRTASRRTSATSRRRTRRVVRERGPCEIHRRSFQALAYRTEAEVERPGRGRSLGTTPSGGPPAGTACAPTGSSTRTPGPAGTSSTSSRGAAEPSSSAR